MSAAYSNLFMDQGTTFQTSIVLDDAYGNTYNLSQMIVHSQIRKSYTSANATATFATTINTGSGTVTLELNANTTANIASGRYVYDAMLTNTISNVSTRILEGIIQVSPSVTR